MTKVLSPDIDKTVLEVLTTGEVLVGTFEFSGGSGSRTISTTQFVAALGSETDRRIFRAGTSPTGYRPTRR